ncbi:DUF4105 domain-containing protein [Pyxidicoccus fallax]|uniref:DUF4105 domain-containing protein n=1 Tax=Pyxidicoccus fallax TaxID=394095 RepID=A0A848LW44_9BACT|nr:DUF4105 domain-containing protein [Pyxidicoccus fallax]NMO22026.1 DUF4105 domain-containing protein [Pyxidicoccus fallax]NPC79082.1 DUF4105 domain-containing protein [Pyxidicoccus fallax]
MPRLSLIASCLLGLLLLAVPATARGETTPPWGTGESRGEDLSIWLVTFSPGDDVPSWWGHGSLVVEDARLRQSRLYNYGMFSFDEAMLARFAMGRLEFWVGQSSVAGTFRFYQREDRDVRIQELNLTPEQRVMVAKRLADNVLPENRDYLYHHYKDNCVTRLRDMIDVAAAGQLREADRAPARMTLREHTRRYTAVNAPMSVLLDFMQNDEIDQPITKWDEAFLPDELEAQVASLQVKGADGQSRPLVAKSWNYYASPTRPRPPAEPPAWGPWVLAIGVALGALAVGLAAWERKGSRLARVLLGLENFVLGLALGFPGTALFIMWLVTDHTVTYRNENLFLANPLTLLAVPFGISLMFGGRKARARLFKVWSALAVMGVLGVVLKVLPPFDQDNWRLIALILPISLGMAGGFGLDRVLARLGGSARASAGRGDAVPSLKAP